MTCSVGCSGAILKSVSAHRRQRQLDQECKAARITLDSDFEIHKIMITTLITYARHLKGRQVGDTHFYKVKPFAASELR